VLPPALDNTQPNNLVMGSFSNSADSLIDTDPLDDIAQDSLDGGIADEDIDSSLFDGGDYLLEGLKRRKLSAVDTISNASNGVSEATTLIFGSPDLAI